MASGRFAMAVHALAVLSRSGEGHPSAYLAVSVNTHAVFLRRILGDLVAAGLVSAREGRAGGYRLARPASAITLDAVYRAVNPDGPIAPSPAEPNASCAVGAGMSSAFAEVAEEARRGLLATLATHTIEDVALRALEIGRRGQAKRRVAGST
jgi:Rrf2 family transcriptional regulator, repressor of oqxAB